MISGKKNRTEWTNGRVLAMIMLVPITIVVLSTSLGGSIAVAYARYSPDIMSVFDGMEMEDPTFIADAFSTIGSLIPDVAVTIVTWFVAIASVEVLVLFFVYRRIFRN